MTERAHVYGKSLDVRFTPAANGLEQSAHSLVSARLYRGYPTSEQQGDAGQASTGHLGSRVTTWTPLDVSGSGLVEYQIIFPPVVDPVPHSGAPYDPWYVVANYLYEADGPEVFDVEQVTIWRSDASTGRIRVTAEDVFELEGKLRSLMRPVDVEKKIALAVEDVMHKLEAKGYERRYLFNQEKLEGAVKRLATAYCCEDMAGEGNQIWLRKAERWAARGSEMFDQAQIGYDISGSGQPDEGSSIQSGAVAPLR